MSEKPESPRVQELEAEARLLAQQGKYGESLMLWVRIWEEKAMAWEAAGKPEYAAAERAQAERCRQRLASLDEPPSESSRVNTWGDVVSQLKELGRVRSFSDRQSLDALEQICRERGMVGLSLKALSNIFAECWQATQKTIGDDTPLSEIVAMLRGSDDDRWCTVAEAAEIYGISAGTISRAVTAKKIKSNGKRGAKRRLDRADLKRWAREKRPELRD